MLFGKAEPAALGKPVHGLAVPGPERLGHVPALVVARGNGIDLLGKRDQVLTRLRHLGDEALVGVDAHPGGMIDHYQLQVVQVGDLVHRLCDVQHVMAVLQGKLPGLDLDRLLRARRSGAAVGFQLAHRAGAEEVGHKLEALAVPAENDGTGGAFAVVLHDAHVATLRPHFGLKHIVRPPYADRLALGMPAEAQDERLLRLTEAGRQGGVLDAGPQFAGLDDHPGAHAVRVAAAGKAGRENADLAVQLDQEAVVGVALVAVEQQPLGLRPRQQIGEGVAVRRLGNGSADGRCHGGDGDQVLGPGVVQPECVGVLDEPATFVVEQDGDVLVGQAHHVGPAVEVYVHRLRLDQGRRLDDAMLEPRFWVFFLRLTAVH